MTSFGVPPRRLTGIGDLNGDGFDDFAMGLPRAYVGGMPQVGRVVVVFGRARDRLFPAEFDLIDRLPGEALFLDGIDQGDYTGRRVEGVGDINGDGLDDLAISARSADPDGLAGAGSVYVVFGRSGSMGHPFPERFSLDGLDGSTGFRLDGDLAFAKLGLDIARAGDPNIDGVDDVLVTSYGEDVAGRTYLIFGRTTDDPDPFPAILSVADLGPGQGCRFDGIPREIAGLSVAGVGDANGDGLDDFVIGAPQRNVDLLPQVGVATLVFGREHWPHAIPLAELDSVVTFRGEGAEHRCGYAVSGIGDFNGDGMSDFAISATEAGYGAFRQSGETYVIYGRPADDPFPPTLAPDQLDGRNGFRIHGVQRRDFSGIGLDGGGDLNGDGLSDILVGAPFATRAWNDSGEVSVIFGGDGVRRPLAPAVLNIADLDGQNGLRILGGLNGGFAGFSVSFVGDVNGDGRGDMAFVELASQQAYVLFGRSCPIDLNGDGVLDVHDFLEFQSLYELGDARADIDRDGVLTLYDFLAFQNAFNTGCP
ncbi:MAG: GC-type dockerin domain-anchored protein [Phycisphaerales bacterium]